jgi:magnesium transporter
MATRKNQEVVLTSIRRFLRMGATANLLNILEKERPADLAEILRVLSDRERRAAFDLFVGRDRVRAMEALAELDPETGAALLVGRSADDVSKLLTELPPDDAVGLVKHLPGELAATVLDLLHRKDADEVVELLQHPESTAGRLMNPRVFALSEDSTSAEAVAELQQAGGKELFFYVYVIDDRGHLVGVVSLRRLLLVAPTARLKDIMTSDVISVGLDADQEEVAKLVTSYNVVAVPVVDHENRLVGTITVDDVIDVIKDETTEDIQKIGGVEALDEPYINTPFWTLIKKRGRWLVVLFFGELLTATAMGYFEKEIAKAVVLALFVPLVISSGGNSGSQAASLIIRALALGEVTLRDWWNVMRREILAGLALGGLLGAVAFARIATWQALFHSYDPHWLKIAFTVSLSLVGVVMWGTLSGSMLPFLMKRLGADPAASSAPFVATLVDVTGLVIYFSVAAAVLRGTLL